MNSFRIAVLDDYQRLALRVADWSALQRRADVVTFDRHLTNDAVQELRGAGAEAMQISGGGGTVVRIIASTYFLDAPDGIDVAGRRLNGRRVGRRRTGHTADSEGWPDRPSSPPSSASAVGSR